MTLHYIDTIADGMCLVCLPWDRWFTSNTDKIGHLQMANCKVGTAPPRIMEKRTPFLGGWHVWAPPHLFIIN